MCSMLAALSRDVDPNCVARSSTQSSVDACPRRYNCAVNTVSDSVLTCTTSDGVGRGMRESFSFFSCSQSSGILRVLLMLCLHALRVRVGCCPSCFALMLFMLSLPYFLPTPLPCCLAFRSQCSRCERGRDKAPSALILWTTSFPRFTIGELSPLLPHLVLFMLTLCLSCVFACRTLRFFPNGSPTRILQSNGSVWFQILNSHPWVSR